MWSARIILLHQGIVIFYKGSKPTRLPWRVHSTITVEKSKRAAKRNRKDMKKKQIDGRDVNTLIYICTGKHELYK